MTKLSFSSHTITVFSDSQLLQNLFTLLSLNCENQALTIIDVQRDPDLLIYCRIEHQFNCDGELVWYKGTVLGFDKETKEFRVLYVTEFAKTILLGTQLLATNFDFKG